MRNMHRILALAKRLRLSASIPAVVAVLACFLLIAHGQQKWTPTHKGSYGRMTRDALNRLLESANDLRTGRSGDAKKVLEGMQGSVDDLTTMTAFFREQADRESDRCINHIKTLENRVAEIYQQEQAAKSAIDDLDAKLTGITERKQLTQNEIVGLRASVAITQQKLQERERKLEELRKWWWVPFYNIYLGVRTLVDDDIGQYTSLKNTLQDKSQQMAHHQREFEAASAIKLALSRERDTMVRTHAGLQEMRLGAEGELGGLKKSAVFLTNAGVFWQRVRRLLKTDLSQSVDLAKEIEELESEMTKENTAPLFDDLRQRPLMELYDSLAAFADTIDQGKNFLEAEGTDFCGGPPRPANGPNVASACNIDRLTRYYEITDPKTCAFRPINPPGCPPRPRPVVLTDHRGSVFTADQIARVATARGAWTRADGENWIDRQRCDPGVGDSIYYGKVQGQDKCELKCMADGTCVSWTFNHGNESVGKDSINECWGSSLRAQLPQRPNSGFQSGGIATRPGGVDCSIFDDGYTRMAGPSDAIFFNQKDQACIVSSRGPVCRKWFGRCSTTDAAAVPVKFRVFDPGKNKDPLSYDLDLESYTNAVGPSDAISFRNETAMACADTQSSASCRRWFGGGVTKDGRKVLCRVFGEPQDPKQIVYYDPGYYRFLGAESGPLDAWTLRGVSNDGTKYGVYALDDNRRGERTAVRWGRCQVQ